MEIQELSNGEKVEIILNQILDNFDRLNGQVERIEDEWCGEGTWPIMEMLNYPDVCEFIAKIEECNPYGPPEFVNLLEHAAELINLKAYYHDAHEDNLYEKFTFNELNEVELIAGEKIEGLHIYKILLNTIDKKIANDYLHFIDAQEDYLVDAKIFRLNTNDGNLIIFWDEDSLTMAECAEPTYEFYRKYGKQS